MRFFRRGCRWVRQQRWRYLDHTLSESDRTEIERHLGVCMPCRAVYAEAQLILEMLKHGQPLPPQLKRKVPRPAHRTPLKAGIALIVIVLLVSGTYLVLNVPVERWLSQRGLARSSQPSPSPANPPPVALVESLPEVPPNRADAPVSAETATPKLAPPKQTLAQPSTTPQRPPTKSATNRPRTRRPARHPNASSKPTPTPPPEGTVEIYDAGGNLIKRHQIKEDSP